MKAYQIKIELQDTNPLVWRRVIMPAGATFNRLNDVIQNVTNFNSGYPNFDYHLFEFDLYLDNIKVTNDEEAYENHLYYKKNRKEVEERVKDIPKEFIRFEEARLKRLKTTIRKPTGTKIDKYIEKYGEIRYTYDFGDNWRFLIKLEEIVDDYPYGYPTLVDGSETAPPEDVGGIPGFYEFLKIYNDPSNPQHGEIMKWANEQRFREYDPEHIGMMLKFIKYKKNEK